AEAIIETAGRQMYRQIRPWLRTVAGDYRQPMNTIEAIANWARAGTTIVNMGWKITTAIVQPLGYLQTVEILGAKYSAIGLRKFYGNGVPYIAQKKAKEFAFERSAQLRNRQHTFDRDVRDQIKELGALTNVKRSWFFLAGMMDMSVAIPSWLGGYQKAMDGELDGVEGGNEQAAIDYADGMVRRSQGAGSAKDLANIQSHAPLMRLFTVFYSYFSILYNLLQRRGKLTRSVKDFPAFAASMFTLWFGPAILAELIAGRGPDADDDETYAEWLKRTFYIWGLYPLSSVIGVRDVANALGPFDYEGSPTFAALEQLTRAVKIPLKAIDPDKEVTRADVKAL
ncbi:hypothetical protein LCGC14_3132610, partial [marine sediment metagenome]